MDIKAFLDDPLLYPHLYFAIVLLLGGIMYCGNRLAENGGQMVRGIWGWIKALAVVLVFAGGCFSVYRDGRVRGPVREATGRNFYPGRPVAAAESVRGANGSLYSITVYRIPGKLHGYFEHPDEKFYRYPRNTRADEGWTLSPWRTGLPREEERRLIEFAPGGKDDRARQMVAAALSRPTTHYAWSCYRLSPSSLGDLDFFIIDPVDDLFFIIRLRY